MNGSIPHQMAAAAAAATMNTSDLVGSRVLSIGEPPTARWSAARATEWFKAQPWRKGANFLPSTAASQLEMFQNRTWDEPTIARELKWAADLGFDVVRVFLHDKLY